MSTDIKPGQVATACGKTLDAFHFACTLPSGHPGYHQDKNGGVFGPGEEHLTTPAPPVPLSMSAVKSGKRLAWTNSGIVVTSLGVENGAVVFQWDNGAQGQLPLSEVANYLQPAPEPEPEWKPGTLWADQAGEQYWFTDDGSADGKTFRNDVGDEYAPSEMGDVRPLVVIDPADVDWRGLQAQMSVLVVGAEPFKRAGDILAVVRRDLGIEAP